MRLEQVNTRSLLIGTVVCALCAAQGGEPVPKFRAETTLVEFTVVALDGKGNTVTDLR